MPAPIVWAAVAHALGLPRDQPMIAAGITAMCLLREHNERIDRSQEPKPMSKTNVLILGPVGTGKTHSLRSVPPTGHRLLVLATEPGIDKVLEHGPLCHWAQVLPATIDWDILIQNAMKVNTLDAAALQKMTVPRIEYRQFIDVLNTLCEFKCDVCGEDFGPVDRLPPEDVFAIDGLSGLSTMARDLVTGPKPIITQPEWGIAMDNLERFLMKCTSDLKCTFVMTAHTERETDEVMGGTKVMVSTLGRKLPPKVPRFFDEVVTTVRRGAEFWWSSTEGNTDLKVRRLPWSDEIVPDFALLLDPIPHLKEVA